MKVKTLKTILTAIIILLSNTLIIGQARMVFNDDAYLVMDGGSAANPIFVTLDNPNDDAITVTNDGNIVSENEFNKLRWFIGGNSGNYQIPYTANTGVKIPYQMQISSAGSGGNFIDFSTYPTPETNLPLPSMVTHLEAANGSGTNEDNVVNRFWINDAENYSTRPAATLFFG